MVNMKFGFHPNRLVKYDRETIIGEIKRALSQHFDNRPCLMKDFSKYSRLSEATIIRHFGTWSDALEKSGYSFQKDALCDLKKVADLHNGKIFSYKFYRHNGGRYGLRMLKKYFNCPSWEALLEKKLLIRKIRILRVIKTSRKRKSLFQRDFSKSFWKLG